MFYKLASGHQVSGTSLQMELAQLALSPWIALLPAALNSHKDISIRFARRYDKLV